MVKIIKKELFDKKINNKEKMVYNDITSEVLNLDIELLESLYNDVIELSSSNSEIDYNKDNLMLLYQ